jgi:hypothetical protein
MYAEEKNQIALFRVFPRSSASYLRFDRIAGFFPGGKAAQDGCHVLEAVVEQEARRTGAGMLVQSGAVGDDPLVRIQLPQAGFEVG